MAANADRLIELLHEALQRPGRADRARFLTEACAGDQAMIDQVASLIEAHERAGNFLEAGGETHAGVRGLEKPGDRLGPYRLGPVLGEGGCGVVYLADQEEPVRRQVALKVIKLGMDTRAVVARFEAERQALAMMDHPNIARVFDAGATDTGRPFFVMELVPGTRITDYCDQAGLSVERRLQLFIQVCRAVQHAHQKGIIHRDLKPSNVLITLQDGTPVPKVIDFGIAKATAGQRLTNLTVFTAFEQFLGTPAYMSPEQAGVTGTGPGDIDTRSDIYSLGVLLYELLTGSTPFETHELAPLRSEGIQQILRDREPPRPSTRLSRRAKALDSDTARPSRIEPDLDWIVMKCLEKDRARRYETANGLAADLDRYLNHEPVVARPPSPVYRLSKALQRNRLAFAAAAAVALSLAVGLATSLRKTSEANQARHLAERRNYALRLTSARLHWQENNLKLVRQALEETANDPNRGFEWYYWQRQIHPEVRVLRGHLAPVTAVAFSPDGRSLVTASLDHTACVWDLLRGDAGPTFRGHYREVWAATFSPDGSEVATAGADRTVRVWNIATGVERLRIPGHEGTITSVAYSPDGRFLASGGFDGSARLWDPATGAPLDRFDHPAPVWTVAFSRDSRRLVAGCGNETAVVWEVSRRDPLRIIAAPSSRLAARGEAGPHGSIPFTACFSPDDQHILTGSRNQTVGVWNAETGDSAFSLQTGSHWLSPMQAGIPFAAVVAPDGRWLVTGRLDHTARTWSLIDRAEGPTFYGHEAEIASVAVSPDGQWVAAGGYDHTARIWSSTHPNEPVVLDGHQQVVPVAAFSRDGTLVVTGSWDGTARLWNVSNGEFIRSLKHEGDMLWAVALSSDARWIFTGGTDRIIRQWDRATGQVVSRLEGHLGSILSITVLPGDRRLLTAAEDGTARVWDLATGTEVLTLKEDWPSVIAAASPDGRYLATVSTPPLRGDLGPRVLTADPDGIVDLQFRGSAHVWDSQTGRPLFPLEGHRGGVTYVSFSADSRFMVTASVDGTARTWETATGRPGKVLEGHSGRVVFASFLPDGSRIVTGGFDNNTAKTRVWDPETGQELLTVTGTLAQAVSPDGRQILVGGDPPARILTCATEEQVAKWQLEERTAATRLQAERRDRAQTARELRNLEVRDWLVLGPLPYPGKDGVAAVDQEWLPNESSLRPRSGDRVGTGATPLIWTAVRQVDSRLDLKRIFGAFNEHTVTYAASYLISDAERKDLLMHVGTDDQARIFLNGREVYRCVEAQDWQPDRDAVGGLELKTGVNVLVLKLINEEQESIASVRFSDGSGRPVRGLRITTEPRPTE